MVLEDRLVLIAHTIAFIERPSFAFIYHELMIAWSKVESGSVSVRGVIVTTLMLSSCVGRARC